MTDSDTDIAGAILARMEAGTEGDVWTPSDFADLGKRSSVNMALMRLRERGDIRRFSRGLYDRPVLNKLTGNMRGPTVRAILDAVARREGIRFVVDGMTAANDLGFQTAVPGRVMVHTDARLAPIKLDALVIEFKDTSGSKLHWAGRPGMRLVQALHHMQDRMARDHDQIVRHIERLLDDPDTGAALADDVHSGFHVLPGWMQDVLRPLLAERFDDDMYDAAEAGPDSDHDGGMKP